MHSNSVPSYLLDVFRKFPVSAACLTWSAILSGLNPVISAQAMASITGMLASFDGTIHPLTMIWKPTVIYLVFKLIFLLSHRLNLYFFILNDRPKIKEYMTVGFVERVLRKHRSYFLKHGKGFLTSKVDDLREGFSDLIDAVAFRVAPNILRVLFGCIALYKRPVFCALLVATGGIFIAGILFILPKIRTKGGLFFKNQSQVTDHITDVIGQSWCVRLFGNFAHEKKLLKDLYDRVVSKEKDLLYCYLWIFIIFDIVILSFEALQLYLLSGQLGAGIITVQDFSFIFFQATIILATLWELGIAIPEFASNFTKIKGSLDAMNDQSEVKDKPNSKDLVVNRGEIAFKDVEFMYENNTRPLFSKLSISIKSGEKVGLVGYSGSGKSSFIKLLLRTYNVHKGSISIDGQNIAEVTASSINASIAVIPQDPMLFERSIYDNIAYGRISTTKAEVIAAAKQADLHELIMKLPDQYETMTNTLSGGQKQRVAIARAILKDAPIFILDEATSQLDSITEKNIQLNLSKVIGNKTTLIIAHRLSTLDQVDRILVFSNGQIVEQGTHNALIAKNGRYADLWRAQVDGYLPETK